MLCYGVLRMWQRYSESAVRFWLFLPAQAGAVGRRLLRLKATVIFKTSISLYDDVDQLHDDHGRGEEVVMVIYLYLLKRRHSQGKGSPCNNCHHGPLCVVRVHSCVVWSYTLC